MTDLFPKNIEEPLYTAVGHMIVNWSFVEAALNTWIATIYHSAGGKHIEPQIPSAFGRKAEFLRRCFSHIASLSSFADSATELIDRSLQLADTRHTVVHGVYSAYDAETLTLTFTKLYVNKRRTMQKANEVKITAEKLMQDGQRCTELAHEMLKLSHSLFETFLPENEPDNLPSKV